MFLAFDTNFGFVAMQITKFSWIMLLTQKRVGEWKMATCNFRLKIHPNFLKYKVNVKDFPIKF